MKKLNSEISHRFSEIRIKKGKFLKRLRIDKGYTQKELANMVNTISTYISAIETGKRSCGKCLAVKLSVIFDCDYQDFL